ncbi:siderophore-interacting protein [Lentzea tibetensis]|uniref:Siderophore-interacting protein n=2 Tax=Lentzea tibetensis TaxID=2591470 RepID=A0A563EJV6_9PSEU|nr:siderophore-interacting protein [Lentzea tibetensis]
MAGANTRAVYDQFEMTVTAVADLSAHLRRVTFQAPEFAGFGLTGPDECFGMLMPPPGAALTMPGEDRINVRAAIRAMPSEQQPDVRWYTVRAHRPEAAEIDVDFVLHGDAGPGTRWASNAAAGDRVGFRAGTSGYRAPDGGRVLLAADETALPALGAILEQQPEQRRHVFAEVPDESYRVPLDADVTWTFRGTNVPGAALTAAIQGANLSTVDYAWVCGESGLATGVRRHLVKDRGIDRRAVMFSGYWKVGSARV